MFRVIPALKLPNLEEHCDRMLDDADAQKLPYTETARMGKKGMLD